ncbi:MAG: ATP-dependent sacrificial sulfur transferase LarE [Planctomycetaceae bacterium]|nr:ATP-dependent sacrificial sulfur transferase LarE [Planctomycetaceae bacterium]
MLTFHLSPELSEKYRLLLDSFATVRSCVIAFSGGVDSSLLAHAAYRVLGDRATAIYLVSETSTKTEQQIAQRVASEIGIRLLVFRGEEFAEPEFIRNGIDRCYHCKKMRFTQLTTWAKEHDVELLVEGSNADDTGDYRPGSRASQELGVRAPLAEIGLTKQEIRQLARHEGLSNWNLPSSPCLATRIEYDLQITVERLQRIAAAEAFLADRGLSPVRVRLHGNRLARIEIAPDQMERFLDEDFRWFVQEKLSEIGFTFVTLDLSGFQSGSMNRAIDQSRNSQSDPQ